MTNPNNTLIGVLVDRSGSMSSCKSDMEGGLNTFITEQAKEPGEAEVTLAQFDTEYEIVYPTTPIHLVEPYTLIPRGGTALLDGMGRFITEVGEGLATRKEGDRPGTVIVCIVTDGEENSSHDWTAEKVKELVESQQRDYQWKFVFLGANMDAVRVAGGLGIQRDSAVTFDSASPVAVASAYSGMSNYVTNTRAGQQASFSEEDRKKATSKSKK